MKVEAEYQRKLITKIENRFPGAIVNKNDPVSIHRQGYPDLLILYKNKWAALETKRVTGASKRPNQGYYVNLLNSMSYASFIYPENEEQVFNELDEVFK